LIFFTCTLTHTRATTQHTTEEAAHRTHTKQHTHKIETYITNVINTGIIATGVGETTLNPQDK